MIKFLKKDHQNGSSDQNQSLIGKSPNLLVLVNYWFYFLGNYSPNYKIESKVYIRIYFIIISNHYPHHTDFVIKYKLNLASHLCLLQELMIQNLVKYWKILQNIQ